MGNSFVPRKKQHIKVFVNSANVFIVFLMVHRVRMSVSHVTELPKQETSGLGLKPITAFSSPGNPSGSSRESSVFSWESRLVSTHCTCVKVSESYSIVYFTLFTYCMNLTFFYSREDNPGHYKNRTKTTDYSFCLSSAHFSDQVKPKINTKRNTSSSVYRHQAELLFCS